jgi:hypothetical protein
MARQTLRQKLNALYASLGLNLRDNDPNSAEMQAAAMAAIEAYRACERTGAVAQITRPQPHLWAPSARNLR